MEKIPQDPIMCMSFVNTRLRNQYGSLEAFCEDYGTDQDRLVEKLLAAGYRYDAARNQFR